MNPNHEKERTARFNAGMGFPEQPMSTNGPTEHDQQLIVVNAALLRLRKGEYRNDADRHSDSQFVREHILAWRGHESRVEHALESVRDILRKYTETNMSAGDALTYISDEVCDLKLLAGRAEK